MPLFAPLGFNWEIVVALIASFSAREVLVSTLAIIFNTSSDAGLVETLQTATTGSGDPLFSLATILSLLAFYVLALQCFPTSLATWREAGSRKFAVLQFLYASFVAYFFAFVVYQIFS